MLKQRLGAAFVLILGFLAALFYLSSDAWALLMGAVALGAAWEWARLGGLTGVSRGLYVLLMGAVLALFYVASSALVLQGVWIGVLLFWLGLAPIWLVTHWTIRHRGFLVLTGLMVLAPTWLALVFLREMHPLVLLFLMGLVWVADSAAYFAGKQWGLHKLAPRISPGKTWEGVMGALAVALVYVWVWRWVSPDTMARFPAQSGWAQSLAVTLLVAVSITGDLFESHFKRVAGMKDSGNLIPGHGGILDRIDSQTSVLPVTVAFIYFGLGWAHA